MNLTNNSLFRQQGYINGKWVNAKETFAVINPATQEKIADIADLGIKETKIAIEAAEQAFWQWKEKPIKERSSILRRWAELIRDNIDDLAVILTTEQGKPLTEAKGEIAGSADGVEWAAEQASLPPGVLNIITSRQADNIGQELCQNPLIKQISFTGSFANSIKGGSEASPFGGCKQSGIGREGGKLCVEEFCETKYIAIGGI